MEMTCECCGKVKAEVKDYRDTRCGYTKYFVCKKCVNKPDSIFFRQMRKTEKLKGEGK